jgi:malonyl-CoA O-methyltransferase
MSAPAPVIDARQVRRNFTRAAATYDAVAVLQREIGGRMLERLDYVKIAPQNVLDLGCGTGASLGALSERYPTAQVLGADVCTAMLQVARRQRSRLRLLLPFLRGKRGSLLAADALDLPIKAGALGLVWSNLMLHWLADPLPALREMQRTLEVGGLLMFSTFGPDTLKELRASISDGYAHCQRFTDMHDYGDMLVACGFADPVMDSEVLTLTYPSLDGLFSDLRQSGSTCAMHDRRRGLMGRATWRAARAAYDKLIRDGRLPATFEVVYGHAWKTEPKKTAEGAAIVRFDPKQRLR